MTDALSAPLVKVCGLTRPDDVAMCEELKVDLVGFIFHPPSPRNMDLERVVSLPRGNAPRVGVFVRQGADEIRSIMDQAGLDLAQLHGDQDISCCNAVGPDRVIKVFWPQRYDHPLHLKLDIERFAPFCRAVLLDAGASGGGHGQSLDFGSLANLALPIPWILAGGLGPQNIRIALSRCTPSGVDLNSGVEHAPGRKNRAVLRRILREMGRQCG